jgi:hypothetical protein
MKARCYVCGNTTAPCEQMSTHLYPEDDMDPLKTTIEVEWINDRAAGYGSTRALERIIIDALHANMHLARSVRVVDPIDFSDIPFADLSDLFAHEETDQ